MKDDVENQILNVIAVGELVIMQDGQRAVVEQVKPGEAELHYIVRTRDGMTHDVEAGTLIRAKVFASWVAPGSDWDGEERRKSDRRSAQADAAGEQMPARRWEDRQRS